MSNIGQPWYADRDEVLAVGHALVYAGIIDTTSELLYFFEKPRKWEREFNVWDDLGQPGLGDEGWSDFVHAVNTIGDGDGTPLE